MFFYTETWEIVFEEPRKCKLTQISMALSIKNEWTKFFTSFTPEALRVSQDSKADGFMDSFVRGCKDKYIYVKKKVHYKNHIPKIIGIILTFQYLTIKCLCIGYFNIRYLVWYTNCYNISREKELSPPYHTRTNSSHHFRASVLQKVFWIQSFRMMTMDELCLPANEMTRQTTRRNINFRYADDTTLMAESKEELKSLLKKVK